MTAIRSATREDAEAICEVARASWHAAYDDLLGEETVDARIDEWYALDGLRESIERSEHIFYVAENTRVKGFVHIGPNPENEGVAELYRIYVRPDWWGEGIGGQLLESAESELEGYDRLTLSVFAANDVGIGFYEKKGFERVSEETIEIEDGEYREYRCEKSLQSL